MEVSKNRENTIIFLTKCLLVVLGLFTTIPYINDVGRDIYKLCCAWCFLCVAYLFIKRTKTFLKLEYVLLFLFCCSFSQISRLIYIQAFGYADIIAKQLQRNNCQ